MRRLSTIAILAVGLSVPAGATAAPGWELPQVSSFVRGDREKPNTSYGRHCGTSQFGRYRIHQGVTIRGRWGGVSWTVNVTEDGRLHRPRKVRFKGFIPRGLKRETRNLLRRVSFRYVPGPPAELQSVFPDGRVQASRPFNPRRRAC